MEDNLNLHYRQAALGLIDTLRASYLRIEYPGVFYHFVTKGNKDEL